MNYASKFVAKHVFAVLFVIALTLRLAVFFGYLMHDQHYFQIDSRTYDLVAEGVARHQGFISPDGTPHTHRLPGYPLFLGILYSIANSHLFALIIQIFLAACIPLLVYMLARKFFPKQPRVSVLAGLMACFHLGLVLYSGFLMSESLFIFFFLLFAYFYLDPSVDEGTKLPFKPWPLILPDSGEDGFVSPLLFRQIPLRALRAKPDQLLTNSILAGIFLGVASMIRPVGHYMIGVLVLLLLFKKQTWRQYAKSVFTMLVGWIIVIAPWVVRNYMLTGALFFHTLPGGHFLQLSAARVIAYEQGISYQDARKKVSHEVAKELLKKQKKLGRRVMEIERCNILERKAQSIFLAYPLTTVRVWLTDIFRTGLSLYSAELVYLDNNRKEFDYFNTDRGITSWFKRYLFPAASWPIRIVVWAEIVFFFMLLNAAFIFVARTLYALIIKGIAKNPDARIVLQCLGMIFFFVVIGLAGGYARMRLPAEPFLIIFASAGVAWVSGRRRAR